MFQSLFQGLKTEATPAEWLWLWWFGWCWLLRWIGFGCLPALRPGADDGFSFGRWRRWCWRGILRAVPALTFRRLRHHLLFHRWSGGGRWGFLFRRWRRLGNRLGRCGWWGGRFRVGFFRWRPRKSLPAGLGFCPATRSFLTPVLLLEPPGFSQIVLHAQRKVRRIGYRRCVFLSRWFGFAALFGGFVRRRFGRTGPFLRRHKQR